MFIYIYLRQWQYCNYLGECVAVTGLKCLIGDAAVEIKQRRCVFRTEQNTDTMMRFLCYKNVATNLQVGGLRLGHLSAKEVGGEESLFYSIDVRFFCIIKTL